MTNPFSGIITSVHKELFNNMIDAVIEQGALSLPCKLIYGDTKFTQCPNCEYDPISKRSAGIYNGSGPAQFIDGQICPVCGGIGLMSDNGEEELYLAVIFDPKHFFTAPGDIKVGDGYIQTLTKLENLSKIKRCKQIIVNTDILTYEKHRFTRESNPHPAGFGDSEYAFTYWKRTK